MTLREQIEALPVTYILDERSRAVLGRQAVLDIIEQHRCIDPERLALILCPVAMRHIIETGAHNRIPSLRSTDDHGAAVQALIAALEQP